MSTAGADDPGPLIRRAHADDAAAIAVFQTDCWREAYAGIVPAAYLERVGVPEREVRWRQRIISGERQVALAELAGRVVGVVSWADTPEPGVPPRQLMSLYVSPTRRGTGLASRLLERAVGRDPAHLWVFEANPRARAFYRRHGFVADGERAVDADTGLDELQLVRSEGLERPA